MSHTRCAVLIRVLLQCCSSVLQLCCKCVLCDFRRIVQVHLCTSDVDIELSQYIKRELHSLHNYLLTSFTSQDIAAFSKHFAKVGLHAVSNANYMAWSHTLQAVKS